MKQPKNIAASVPSWVRVGVRLMERPGMRSQRCGTVVSFASCNYSAALYPVVVWDDGAQSFTASDLIDVSELMEEQQISIPLDL